MCFSIAKYLLFIFNTFIWLGGASCVGVGIWLSVDEHIAYSLEVSGVDVFYAGTGILIAAGAMMFVVGFLGCLGAIKESQVLLGLYFGFLFVIFGLEVGIGIWALVSFESIEEVINESFSKFDATNGSIHNPLIAIQKNFSCCGKTLGCKDWSDGLDSGSYGCGCNPEIEVNGTCLKISIDKLDPTYQCRADPTWENTVYDDFVYSVPCSTALNTIISDNFVIIGAVALAIGLAEIIGMIIAVAMIQSIKKKSDGD